MSIEAVATVLNHSKAKGRAKLVLIGIANHLGDQGAWPSISTLARYANASERSVKRDLQELMILGELQVDLQSAPMHGQYKTNLYWITIAHWRFKNRCERKPYNRYSNCFFTSK